MNNLAANLSIIIVNFNSGKYLLKCLDSLENSEIKKEVYVVDNASQDNSISLAEKKYHNIHFIENKENLGFGKANNTALKEINTPYVLFLNPDCEVLPGALKVMVDFMDNHPEVGAASCKVEKEDGSLDLASHRGFPTPFASLLYFLGDDSLYHLTSRNMKEVHEVDGISGAFFLTRKSTLEKVGNFDEEYFLYGEDLDLSYRIKKEGFKIMYIPKVRIIHHKGISSGLKKHSQHLTTASLESRKKALDSFYQTMKIFYKKHLEKKYPFFISWLVYLGINLKWFLAKRKMEV